MSQLIRTFAVSAAAAAAILVAAAPAVSEGPYLIRRATLNGVDGPVYYSVIERGYRPLAALPTVQDPDGAAPRQIARIN